ncbi:hypothetical protein [Bacillus songklensis]|uniref:hypothetical protein n=1 Tax=Bacillus songklensis TaxID=1069116 RepID=UPI00366ED845
MQLDNEEKRKRLAQGRHALEASSPEALFASEEEGEATRVPSRCSWTTKKSGNGEKISRYNLCFFTWRKGPGTRNPTKTWIFLPGSFSTNDSRCLPKTLTAVLSGESHKIWLLLE